MYKILANTAFLGKDVHFLSECHSTNDTALSLIKANLAHEGSIVICDHQSKGKGQRGNSWHSERGMNLTFSLILKPGFMDISEQFYLNMAISTSVRSLLQEYVPGTKVKWPNDVVIPGFGKIGGILIENTFSGEGWEYAVVGIGLNINQKEHQVKNVTSLKQVTGSHFDLQELFRLIIAQIEHGYIQLKRGRWNTIKSVYLSNLFLFGVWSEFFAGNKPFLGKIVGVTDEGKLEVVLQGGEKQLFGLKEIAFGSY